MRSVERKNVSLDEISNVTQFSRKQIKCDCPRDELLSASTGIARGEGLGKNTPGLLGRGFSWELLGGYECPRIFKIG